MFFLLAFNAVTVTGVAGMHNISVIISFPFKYIGGSISAWKRGLEILTGTYVAVDDINNDSGIISYYNLHLIAVDSGIDEYDSLEETIDRLFHQPSLNIVGISGFLSPKAVTLLLPLVRQRGKLLSAPSE